MTNKKTLRRLVLLLLCFLGVASLFFWGLSRWDNKYTAPGAQPISGVLALSEAELAKVPCRFLIQEWEFYPGVLLTPDDFAKGTSSNYRQYVSLGQYGGMETGNAIRSPHGSGTYRLTLLLPEGQKNWVLALPEIFSSCRLYINNDLLLQLGDPSPESYQERIQRRMIPFSGSGQVQLFLQVSDYSGFFSGPTHPLLARPRPWSRHGTCGNSSIHSACCSS